MTVDVVGICYEVGPTENRRDTYLKEITIFDNSQHLIKCVL